MVDVYFNQYSFISYKELINSKTRKKFNQSKNYLIFDSSSQYIIHSTMKNPSSFNRVYIDRSQTKQLKMSISKNYLQNIAPHELLLQSLALQNKQIYSLQQKYKQLLKETQSSKSPQQYTSQQKQILLERQQLKIHQRKLFVQQGLKANSLQYHQEFLKKKHMREDELDLKKDLLKELKGRNMNVFFNLDQGIIEELIQYIEQKWQQELGLEEKQKGILIEELNVWKKRYQTEVLNSKSVIMED